MVSQVGEWVTSKLVVGGLVEGLSVNWWLVVGGGTVSGQVIRFPRWVVSRWPVVLQYVHLEGKLEILLHEKCSLPLQRCFLITYYRQQLQITASVVIILSLRSLWKFYFVFQEFSCNVNASSKDQPLVSCPRPHQYLSVLHYRHWFLLLIHLQRYLFLELLKMQTNRSMVGYLLK